MEPFSSHTDLFSGDNLNSFDIRQYQRVTSVTSDSAASATLNSAVSQNTYQSTTSFPSHQTQSVQVSSSSLFSDTFTPGTTRTEFSVLSEAESKHVTSSIAPCDRNYDHYDDTDEEPSNDVSSLTEDKAVVELEVPDLERMTSINNVVCTYSTRCHLNLKRIALQGNNVIFKRENNMVNMKLRKPKATASIWSSGKITCTGSESEDFAHIAARRIARRLQKMGFRVRFSNFRVVNVLGTCFLPFAIKLNSFSNANRTCASYEPELHPAVTYRMKEPKATIKLFSTGSLTITAPRVENIHIALRNIYPLAYPHQLPKTKLNPREFELTKQFMENPRPSAHTKVDSNDRYQQFRYTKRLDDDESIDSESSYGEDSDAG